MNGSKPYILSVQPVDYSLTAGTDIPAPPQTPVKETPIPNGGPLSSHPSTPEKIPGAWPVSDDENETSTPEKKTMDSSSPPVPQHMRRTSGVRRLFSLNNLRSSFSSSRTSLALTRPSTDRPPSSNHDRAFSPSLASTSSSSPNQYKPSLNRKRSGGSWFKRKTSLFSMNHDGTLDAVGEDQTLQTPPNKRLKSYYSVPLLPDISELGGGDLGDGDLGWDASVFKRV